jgi:sphinganine-1-phosphate aldolase
MRSQLPKSGRGWQDIEQEMSELRRGDVDWRHGRAPFYIWYGGDDVFDVAKKAYTMFMQENGGGTKAFGSLKQMEEGVLDFAAGLLNGPDSVGHITSGGSESIFVAMKAARDWARANKPHIKRPEVVAPFSAHPTFNRAAQYLDLTVTRIPVAADFRADVAAMEKAVGENTIAVVGSACCFPFGVIDPIAELGALAFRNKLWLHVDACIGGYSAPFVKRLGYPVPDFDFSVPGVCSISADLHKYGFCAKGTSSVLYRNADLEKYQPFSFDEWPQGHFANPNVASTRPGGSIAAAWAVMNYLGEEGYMRLNDRLMKMRQRYIDGINAIDGLHVQGKPHLLMVSYAADPGGPDILAVGDELAAKGWYVGKQAKPHGILLGLNVLHEPVVDEYLGNLTDAVAAVRKSGRKGDPGAVSTY